MALKHVGRDAKTHRKVIVAYRVVPGEPDNCLIIKTESLDAASHDSLMTAVESNAGQNADEFAEAMFRTTLPDGLNMLTGLQKYGKLVKVPTASIDMTPDTKSSINLAELNKVIAEQKGVTIADLALKGKDGKTVVAKDADHGVDPVQTYSSDAPVAQDSVLTDADLAAQYRSQADALFKEAQTLRKQAEELVPTKKKTKSDAKETA
jgi:hypothetical protein|tara:strand:+ start:1105 stop:1725 length:621 start_codon:yes stop_codon:yes gene_type:complete